MGNGYYMIMLLYLMLLQFLDPYTALPLCTDSRAPFAASSPLKFCSYNVTTCCSDADDSQLEKRFESMNISDSACASVVKSILCARCDPFSAQLFTVETAPREIPLLCNSTFPSNPTQSNQDTNSFCSEVWSTCQNISISNSPFKVSKASNSTKLADLWRSQQDFCTTVSGPSNDRSTCYTGAPVTLTNSPPPLPAGMCLEKIANGSYINMAAHTDGSNRAFFANQQGKIWLADIPQQGSGGVLGLDESNPFLDITDEVHFDSQFGMLGVAFHPNFTENGRFFVSFNCDKDKWPDCEGRCACNSDVDCDPSELISDGSDDRPCRYLSVIAEFTANGSSSQPGSATSANPREVRRIFTMGLPSSSHHGGQILFGPKDGYLYFMMGDGGGVGDPYNFAQNKKSLLGKIMRFDIDNIPSAAEISELGLWGNYSIPKDNPYLEDKEMQKEIWAVGLRNPWRCSFDSSRPSYFICADVGENQYEEVNLISKDGNYGWRAYEGPSMYTPPHPPKVNASLNSDRLIFPVMGYNHSEVNSNEGSASITGGYIYRSKTDPCLQGRYIYADLYAGSMWAGTENPINSGNFNSSKISFNCATDSPLNCTYTPGNSFPALSYIFSFGEDNNKDLYLLTNTGVYRVVPPSRCSYTCVQENVSASSDPASSLPSTASFQRSSYGILLVFVVYIFMLVYCPF